MNEENFKQLLKKYHQNQLNDSEQKQLEAFEKKLLKRNSQKVFKSSFHEQQVHQALLENITKEQPKGQWKKVLAIAASFAILISLGLGVFSIHNSSTPPLTVSTTIISNADITPMTVELEDGSTVILNRQSRISYIKGFEGDFRKVEMQGEAFFQVARNKDKPFIVGAGDIVVQVLGTEFNVLEADSAIDITVASGEVQVYNNDESFNLVSNEQINYDRHNRTMSKRRINHQLNSLWKQEQISLKGISMAEFSMALEQTHGYTLHFKREELADLQLAISYSSQEPIEEIIEKVNYINNLNLIKTTETMIIVTK